MCGISAAIGEIDPEICAAVRVMTEQQRHRGPDSGGYWQSSGAERFSGAALGHRRLAIIDLNPESDQPMIDSETGNSLVFNGEIYNYRALREELTSLGSVFRTESDTEVVLKAYAHWGAEFVSRLRGMFAFVLWDSRKKKALIARDRLGIKPLYWTVTQGEYGKTLLVASEIRALLETGLVDRRMGVQGLSTYLWNGFVFGPSTIVRDIHLFPAGSTAAVTETGILEPPTSYWSIPVSNGSKQDPDELRHALEESVKLRLVSDVPLGLFLSGGVDSSAICAMAANGRDEPLMTFNVAFDESEYDESGYARQVAQALRSQHTEIRLTQTDFADSLRGGLDSLDQPSFDMLNTYLVSKATREAGVTVALSGLGGDELFGGYRSFSQLPLVTRIARLLGFLPTPIAAQLGKLISRIRMGSYDDVPPQTSYGKLADVFEARGSLLESYQVSSGLYTNDLRSQLSTLAHDEEVYYGWPAERIESMKEMLSECSPLHAISMLELTCFVTERLLRDTDVASMASGLEVRVPLIDHEVIEALAKLPDRERYLPLGKKSLLRNIALEGIDPRVFDRPKSGFELPLNRWCLTSLRGEIEDVLGDARQCEKIGLDANTVNRLWRAFQQGSPGMYWSRVWSIFVLLSWSQKNAVEL